MEIKLKHKLVIIEWNDSMLGFQGWKSIKENIENTSTRFVSVGFLVHSDNENTTLYPHIENSLSDDLSGTGDIVIPNSAILSMQELSV